MPGPRAAGVVGIFILVLAACGEPRAVAEDLLFLQSPGGVAIVRSGGGPPEFSAAEALPSHDWSTVVRTVTGEDSTQILAEDPSSGAELWSRGSPGRLEVKAVSGDGDIAVLEPAGRRYRRSPTVTKFVIARRSSAKLETIELEGNFAPEAFSTDGAGLFVVQYFPARRPNRYQVRRLDLATGVVKNVYSVDAELQESMRGTARIQAMSPDGTRLYTLYSLKRGGDPYAFVHVLSLDEQWAHCVDLPPDFAEGAESSTALAVAPDGRRLYVASAPRRKLAEIDTEELTIARTSTVDFGWGQGTHAAVGSDSALYLASGHNVVAVDRRDLDVTRSWELDLSATGLQDGGGKLYVGQDSEIAVLDTAPGAGPSHIDPKGVGRIKHLGKVMPALQGARSEFICAC